MNNSVVEKVLGNLHPYTSTYLEDTLLLSRSIVIHSKHDARRVNDAVTLKYRKPIKWNDKTTWRYYKHLNGEYHEVDTKMKVISLDDRQEIILTKESLRIHIDTLKELQMFGSYYDEVMSKYPEQGTLLRSMMATNDRLSLREITELDNWQIVSYNAGLVEPQEYDLIIDLQKRIDNYAVKNMIMHYAISNNMFLPVMKCALFSFTYNSILSLRYRNVKTSRVHSYHMLSYFASHHGLDSVYQYLDDYQRLYLYKNMLYLDSHAGKNSTLEKLIDVFFNRKRMVVVNYEYQQLSEIDDELDIKYGFVQTLLNKTKFSHPKDLFSLDNLAEKEIDLAKGNEDEYKYNKGEVNYGLINSRDTKIKTKDLEVTISDSSNLVRYKLLDVTLDYWAVTTELGYNETLVNFTDPISGKDLYLTSKEAFQLYQISILLSVGYEGTTLPDSVVWSAFREDIFGPEASIKSIMKPWWYVNGEIEEIYAQRPKYQYMQTRSSFRAFIEKVYRYELGMSIFLDNESEFYSRHDIEKGFEDLHRSYNITNNNLNIKSFLHSKEIEDIVDYSKDNLLIFANALLDRATDGVLSAAETYRLTQKAVLTILSKFKSYTTQILSNFQINDGRLVGAKTPRISTPSWVEDFHFKLLPDLNVGCFNVEEQISHTLTEELNTIVGSGIDFHLDIKVNHPILANSDEIFEITFQADGLCIMLDEESTTKDSVLTWDHLGKLIKD